MTGTIGVEPITPETRPLLTDREYRATHAVVARQAGRVRLLATARRYRYLTRAAEQLARTYAAEHVAYDPRLHREPVIAAGDCVLCAGPVEVATAEVRGAVVEYVRHVKPAAAGDRTAHAAMVLGVAA